MSRPRFLRIVLGANAVFSSISGSLSVLFSSTVESWVALPIGAIRIVGLVLVAYGLALSVVVMRVRVSSAVAVTASALDAGWVIGSAMLLVAHPVPERTVIVGVAAVVLTFAVLQLEGVRRAMFLADKGRRVGVLDVERVVRASPARAWNVISDVGRYAEVAGTLHRSEVVSGTGLGMVRRCEDTKGVCWTETCTRWDDQRGYAFEVDTSAPGYPLPLRTMRGDFEVEPARGRRAVIKIRFTFEPRGGYGSELGLSLVLALRGRALVAAILQRWTARIEAAD